MTTTETRTIQPRPDRLRFTVGPVASSKNSRNIVRPFVSGFDAAGNQLRGDPRIIPNKRATSSRREIKQAAIDQIALGRMFVSGNGTAAPLFGDDDVEVNLVYHARSETVDVEVRSVGPRPKGPTGRKRDLQGMIETVCDALNKLAYEDDRQVVRVALERVLD